MGAHVAPQGAARRRAHPRPLGAGGSDRARVHAARRRASRSRRCCARPSRTPRPTTTWSATTWSSSAAYVDEGPVMKRWRARARGRAARIRKPTCHITIKLTPVERAPEPAPAPKPGRAEGRGGKGRGEPKKKAAPKRKPAAKQAEEDRGGGGLDGPEDPSRRPARGRHPRLEVELVHGDEGVLRRSCSRTSRSASTSTASSSTRACPTS